MDRLLKELEGRGRMPFITEDPEINDIDTLALFDQHIIRFQLTAVSQAYFNIPFRPIRCYALIGRVVAINGDMQIEISYQHGEPTLSLIEQNGLEIYVTRQRIRNAAASIRNHLTHGTYSSSKYNWIEHAVYPAKHALMAYGIGVFMTGRRQVTYALLPFEATKVLPQRAQAWNSDSAAYTNGDMVFIMYRASGKVCLKLYKSRARFEKAWEMAILNRFMTPILNYDIKDLALF